MKSCLSILIITFLVHNVFSQSRKPPLFLSQKEKDVVRVLDSLNKLSSNSYYTLKRTTNNNGDLVLTTEYSMADEKLYKCIMCMVTFTNVFGEEKCISQTYGASAEYADEYMKPIRDNYKNIETGVWLKEYKPVENVAIQATFERLGKERNSAIVLRFDIVYDSTFSTTQYPEKEDWTAINDKEFILKYPKKIDTYNNEYYYTTLVKKQFYTPYEFTLEFEIAVNCNHKAIRFIKTRTFNNKGKITNFNYTDGEWESALDFHPDWVGKACELYKK